MSRMRFLPFMMIVVLALASLGVGYGLWSQTLIINGTVHTGEMDSALSIEEIDQNADFNDFCPSGGYSIGKDCDGDGFLNDELEFEGKDVAECSAVLVDPYTMEVTVSNAYPYFNCFLRYDVENTGSIPIHIYRPGYFYNGEYMGSAINTAELHVNGWPPNCYLDETQLHPGEEAYCNLHIAINQPAAEEATYTFQLKVFTRQWNEIVTPPWIP